MISMRPGDQFHQHHNSHTLNRMPQRLDGGRLQLLDPLICLFCYVDFCAHVANPRNRGIFLALHG